jgi:hypothetical protein
VLDDAKKRIEEKDYKFYKMREMQKILEWVQEKGSISAAKDEFIKMSKNKDEAIKKFSKRLNEIRKLNINPVTLPNNSEIKELAGLDIKVNEYFQKVRSPYEKLRQCC